MTAEPATKLFLPGPCYRIELRILFTLDDPSLHLIDFFAASPEPTQHPHEQPRRVQSGARLRPSWAWVGLVVKRIDAGGHFVTVAVRVVRIAIGCQLDTVRNSISNCICIILLRILDVRPATFNFCGLSLDPIPIGLTQCEVLERGYGVEQYCLLPVGQHFSSQGKEEICEQ